MPADYDRLAFYSRRVAKCISYPFKLFFFFWERVRLFLTKRKEQANRINLVEEAKCSFSTELGCKKRMENSEIGTTKYYNEY